MNNNKMIRADKVRLAKIKYFDLEHNGVEITSDDPYVFLIKVKDSYVNLFDPTEDMPVYDRLPYSNTTKDGEDFGSKILLIQGDTKEGLCYVLENTKLKDLFDRDLISINDLIKYMISSDKYFVDRKEYILDSSLFKISKKLRSKYFNDCKKLDDFKYYVNNHNKGVQYIK